MTFKTCPLVRIGPLSSETRSIQPFITCQTVQLIAQSIYYLNDDYSDQLGFSDLAENSIKWNAFFRLFKMLANSVS